MGTKSGSVNYQRSFNKTDAKAKISLKWLAFFVKTRVDSAAVFEPAKHVLDEMAFYVQIPVAISLYFTISFARSPCCRGGAQILAPWQIDRIRLHQRLGQRNQIDSVYDSIPSVGWRVSTSCAACS